MIKVTWVRDSTGSLQARILAEKDNPRNDLYFGHSVTNLLALDALNMLLPYRSVGVEKLKEKCRDQRDPPGWAGLWGFGTVICFNTEEAKKRNLPPDLASRMIKNDFSWASANQADILKEWLTRYDSKTELKK